MALAARYSGWTRERLIERLIQLEEGAQQRGTAQGFFDFSKHPRRKIALRFCYSGWDYSGLAYQKDGPSALPPVENVLFDNMAKACLVDPTAGLDGCGWERCGRTDRGVSAAGQVVSLWIRSHQESTIDYTNVLNRLLPDTIRVIAWSPVSDSFSARFSCKYRHYKYFFSALHLDVPRMQSAATRLIGEHDFRNMCKLDVQKQLTSFSRKILRASITPVDDDHDDHDDKMYVFDLVGTAFLYHQVRHIMAALFLVGSGFERPEVITELMNVEPGAEPMPSEDEPYAVVNSKPDYQMADGLPLVLWECGYDESELDWRTTGRNEGELHHQLRGIYTRSRIYSVLNRHFMKAVRAADEDEQQQKRVINVPLGGGTFKRLQKYKPLLERKRLDTVQVMNERWRVGKGSRKWK